MHQPRTPFHFTKQRIDASKMPRNATPCPSLSLRVDYFGYAFKKWSTWSKWESRSFSSLCCLWIALRSKACRRLMVERSYHRRGWSSQVSTKEMEGMKEKYDEICTWQELERSGMSFQHVWLLAHLELLQQIWRRETLYDVWTNRNASWTPWPQETSSWIWFSHGFSIGRTSSKAQRKRHLNRAATDGRPRVLSMPDKALRRSRIEWFHVFSKYIYYHLT